MLAVKHLPADAEMPVPSLCREVPLEKGITTRSSILAWRIPWTEEPGSLQSMGLQSQTWLSTHITGAWSLLSLPIKPKNAMNYIWITVEIRRTLSLKDIYIYLQSPNSRTCTLPTIIWSKDISPRVSFLHNKCHLIAPAPSHPVTHWSQNPLTLIISLCYP